MSIPMMEQRKKIEKEIQKQVELCLQSIRKNGEIVIPTVIVNLKTLVVANRRYFEENGFCFTSSTQIEEGMIKYFAIMSPIYNGKIADYIREKITEAQKEYKKKQLEEIKKAYKLSVEDIGIADARVSINMKNLIFENRATLEEQGFYFEPINADGVYWMIKR